MENDSKIIWMNIKDIGITLGWLLVVIVSGGIALLPFKLGGAIGALGVIFITVPFGIICVHVLARKFIASIISRKMASQIFFPEGGAPPPPEFPQIRAKIAKEQHAEAASDLEELLKKDPGNYHVIALLVEIFVEKTGDHENAIGLINAYLRKDGRCLQDIPIVMKLVDVYLDLGSQEKALGLLRDELGRKYPADGLKALRARLDGIEIQINAHPCVK